MPYNDAFADYLETTPDPRVVVALRVTLPGTAAPILVASTELGPFRGWIKEDGVGDVTVGVDARTGSLEALETTVQIIDVTERESPDFRRIMRALEGSADPRRSPCVLYWASPDLDEDEWQVILRGILDRVAYKSGGLVELTIRTDDRWLRGGASRWPLLPSEFPNAPDPSLKSYLPVVYGVHLSTNLSGRGFLPVIPVSEVADTEGRTDFVSLGWINVTKAFRIRDNVVQSLTVGAGSLTVNHQVVGGKACTILSYHPEVVAVLDTDTVQADAEGQTTLGDGTGTLIANPIAQIRHWLVNFAHGRWLSGDWLSETNSPIEPVSWATTEADAARFKLEGSFRIGGTADQETVEAAFTRALQTWLQLRPWWTEEGKLAMGFMDARHPGYGDGSFFDLVRERALEAKPEWRDDPSRIVDRVSMTHLFDIAGNKSWGSMDVQDPTRDEHVTETVQMTDSVSKFG